MGSAPVEPGDGGMSALLSIAAAITVSALLLVLPWRAEYRRHRARRLRSYGWSQQRIAQRLGCSMTTVRRLLAR